MSAEHIENVMEHDDSQTQSETHSTPSYSATRRTARKHKRVVRQREADDDKRILNELPPHWAVFSERGR